MFSAKTERLLISGLSEEDAGFAFRLMNSPGWLKFIGDRGIRTEADARHYLRQGPVNSYAVHGFGLWKVSIREDLTPIGFCGLLKRDFLEAVDIGFAFLPEYNGKGYAFESAAVVLEHAVNTLKLPKILAIVTPGNESSIRLVRKLGLVYEREINWPGESGPLLQFSTVG